MIYLACAEGVGDGAGPGEGPWTATFVLAPGVLGIESDASRSVVYHALKDVVGRRGALLVVELERAPKLKGMAPGSLRWFTDRGLPR